MCDSRPIFLSIAADNSREGLKSEKKKRIVNNRRLG